MFEFVFLFFGSSLIFAGFVFLGYGLMLMVRNSYKPRFTRSTYLPPKR
jgi:hypothetical protein